MPSDRDTPPRRRVLLANLNGYDQPYPVYPLGIAYLDGGLREAGHETRIWDAHVSPEGLEAAIAAFAPDYIALSMRNVDNVQYHNPRSFVDELLGACRRARDATGAKIILGGSGFSVFPRELFGASCADYGIHGEGEASFPQLIQALETGGSLEGLSGLLFRRPDGTIQMNACSARDTAFCTVPRHDEAILRAYSAKGSLPGVQTQRGCPLRCCYCTYPSIEGKKSRYRTGEEIVEEMRRLLALGTNFTFIVDSVFNTRADHVVQVCEALARADLPMEWQCFLRPRNVSRDLLKLMHRAGLRHVEFGSDSFSDPVLKRYGKSFTWEEIEQASLDAHELGLRYSHFLIFGGPGETPESVEETVARAQSLSGAFYFATIGMRIYPDTPLWRELNPEAHGESAQDYFREPRFFLEPPFTVQSLYSRLARHRDTYHNWVIGDPPPTFLETVGKLRARGVRGPMWEYIETLQRFAQSQDRSKQPVA